MHLEGSSHEIPRAVLGPSKSSVPSYGFSLPAINTRLFSQRFSPQPVASSSAKQLSNKQIQYTRNHLFALFDRGYLQGYKNHTKRTSEIQGSKRTSVFTQGKPWKKGLTHDMTWQREPLTHKPWNVKGRGLLKSVGDSFFFFFLHTIWWLDKNHEQSSILNPAE